MNRLYLDLEGTLIVNENDQRLLSQFRDKINELKKDADEIWIFSSVIASQEDIDHFKNSTLYKDIEISFGIKITGCVPIDLAWQNLYDTKLLTKCDVLLNPTKQSLFFAYVTENFTEGTFVLYDDTLYQKSQFFINNLTIKYEPVHEIF